MFRSKEEEIMKHKEKHNFLLKRYLKGCDYLAKNTSQKENWLPELLNIQDNINANLEELMKLTSVTDKEILEGFNIRRTDEQ